MKTNFLKPIEDVRHSIIDAFKFFFAMNPKVKTIQWVQYTPYFNDGDECRFRVGSPYLTLDPDFKFSLDFLNEDYKNSVDEQPYEGFWPKQYKCKEVYECIDHIDSFKIIEGIFEELSHEKELYKIIFEDNHVTVILSVDGFTTEYFEHE